MPLASYSLGARWIHPIASPPLEDFFINVRDDRIESLTPSPTQQQVFDLDEECRILPGAVNAHTHLELSQLPWPLDVPPINGRRSFTAWIDKLMAFRRSDVYDAESAFQKAALLPQLLVETAVIGDIAPPSPIGELKSPHRIAFFELIAWTEAAAIAKLDEAKQLLDGKSGLSPHAPQTVHPAIWRETVRWNVPLAVHLAETPEEIELLRFRRGPILELMRRADPTYDPESVLLGDRPLDYLKVLAEAPQTLVVHGNYLDDEEIAFLGERPDRMTVAYCPRTHAYFGHDPYPLRKMLDAGVCVALGTDSLASSPDLSLLSEMQFVHRRYPDIPLETIFRMGTLNGALALGVADQYGTLEPGKIAAFSFWATP